MIFQDFKTEHLCLLPILPHSAVITLMLNINYTAGSPPRALVIMATKLCVGIVTDSVVIATLATDLVTHRQAVAAGRLPVLTTPIYALKLRPSTATFTRHAPLHLPLWPTELLTARTAHFNTPVWNANLTPIIAESVTILGAAPALRDTPTIAKFLIYRIAISTCGATDRLRTKVA